MCPKCGERLATNSELAKHVHTIHGLFVCAPCGLTFKKKFNLERHQSKKSCLRLATQNKLAKDLQTIPGLFVCAPCGLTFKKKFNLERHLSKKSCLEFDSNAVHQCNLCDAKFCSQFLLNEHIRKSRCPKKYQCLDCASKPYFSKKDDLRIHSQVAHGAFDDSRLSENDSLNGMPRVAPKQLVTLQISGMGTSISVSVPRECIEPGSKSQEKLYKVLKENLNQAGTAFLSPENAKKSIQAQLERVFV